MIGDKPFILRAGRFRLKIWKRSCNSSYTNVEFEYNQFDKDLNKWIPFRVRIFVEDMSRLKELVDLFYDSKDELNKGGYL